MMDNEMGFNASSQNNKSNSSDAYLQRAASAVEQGDAVLAIHLYLAAYERALTENIVPNGAVLQGMAAAWKLALEGKQRSLAEYIFEKLEPFWTDEEVSHHAEELQRMAFAQLEESGVSPDALEDMAEILNDMPDMLCQYKEFKEGLPSLGSKKAKSEPEHREEPADQPAPAAPEHVVAQPMSMPNLANMLGEEGMNMLQNTLGQFGVAAVIPANSAAKEAADKQAAAPRFNYRSLAGFDRAVAHMNSLGVGKSHDPEFRRFVEMLNFRHGVPGMPGLGTLVFSSPSREDANYFMVATVGELEIPAVRMRLDQNAQGQPVLCVMASPDFKARLSSVSRTGFESPAALILEDLDLWNLPLYEGASYDEYQGILQMQLSRGAREALGLIQAALDSPDVTVMVSAANPEEIEGYFQDMLGVYRRVNIGLPTAEERKAVWRAAQLEHPSLRGLDVLQMVRLSRTLSRFEIYAIANEAVEDAYRKSLAANEFRAVDTVDLISRLSNFQELDSREYHEMEELAVQRFRSETGDFDDLLEG